MKNLLHLLNLKILVPLFFIGGLSLVCSSLFIEHVIEVKPCQMCLWQRYIHLGIAAIALLGWVSRKYLLGIFGVVLGSLTGFTVAIWHTLVQQKIIEAPGCGDSGDVMPLNPNDLMASLNAGNFTLPSCDKIDFTIFGLSLANWNVIVMLSFMLVAILAICYNRCK